METGIVKFFDTREGKLFGFVVDEMGNELFFHYSDGMHVAVHESPTGLKSVSMVQLSVRLRFPQKGDRLMFVRGKNLRGPKAARWCFKPMYDEMVEKSKRYLTLEEAKKYLADKECNILEHTYSTTQYGAIITTVTTEVTWIQDGGVYVAANGKYIVETTRYGSGLEETKSQFQVSVHTPDQDKFKPWTAFNGPDALALKDLGNPGLVRRGKMQSILWNGGWDDYVVDANLVRDMTDDEVMKHSKSAFPTFEDGNHVTWLRCLFAASLGHAGQVVRVLAHLGSGD